MATTDAQTLASYTQAALTSLEETTDPSALSKLTKELYVRAREYPTFRDMFKREDVRQAVGEALVKGDAEALKAILIGILTEAAQEVRPEHIREIPGPDPFTAEESYASVMKPGSGERVARLSEVEEASQLYVAEKKSAQRRRFAQQLTNNFISRSKAHITEEQKLRETERAQHALSPEWYRNKAEIDSVIEQSPYRETVSDHDLQQIAGDAQKAAREVSAAQERVREVLVTAATSIANTDEALVYKPAVFLNIAADQAVRSNTPVTQIVNRAAALERATEGFTGEGQALPQNLSFLAKTPLQKLVAGVVDALPEGPRSAIIAGVVGGAWEKAVDAATRYYGQQVVGEDWFQQAIARGNQGLPDKKTALLSLTSGVQKVLGDVAGTVFRAPMNEATIAYLETIRLHITVTETVTYQQFYTAAVYSHNPGLLSYGLNVGFQYGTRKLTQGLIKAGAEKAIAGTATKGALKLLAGVGTGGWGFLVGLGLDALGGLLKKSVGAFKNLIGVGGGTVPGDTWLLIGAALFALVFFIPILPLFNLPAFNQSMIDTSLANSLTGGGPPDTNQYLDVSITATPASLVGTRPTAMTYNACVKPKGSPDSFKINGANATFSVYGGSGNSGLNAPTITPAMFSDGCFSFTVPFGPQLQDSVITATFTVNADVGPVTGVDGSASVSTVLGNPPTGCFVFGGAGVHDLYGHVSTTWDNTSGMFAAIGVLARSPQYMARVCAGGKPVTLYRVNANFGGGSAGAPNSIFIYNACVTGCATYTLAHETGHIVDARTGLFGQYNGMALYAREGPLWTYPNGFSEHEDFAETLGAYVVWRSYVWGARHEHAAGNLNYPEQYPLHYQFAKGVFGIEY